MNRMKSSRSDAVHVAVGFNPRFADRTTLAVAERRLNTGVLSNLSSVAPRRQTVRSIVWIIGSVVLPCLLWTSVGAAAQLDWHVNGTVKWAELKLPNQGKTGFTQMLPDQTGVNFTNRLDEWSSAANRVLENGSGAAVGDFDRDGRPDIFLCSLKGQNALYRNLGAWKFEDVTLRLGVNATNHVCRGAVFADVNGDGWLDLMISTLGHGVLCFRNDGKGRFTDVTQETGTETKLGSTTLALADIDSNGTLDLYVTNYRAEDIRDRSRIDVQRINGRMVVAPGLRDRVILVKEGLLEYGEPDILYLNDGRGHFGPVSWTGGSFLDESGRLLTAPPLDWGLAATFRDLDGDGDPDLYVCNDYWTPDRIWINDGQGKFRPIARLAVRHTSENSMGVDFADLDRDGHMDFLVLDMLSRNPSLRKRQVLAQAKISGAVGEIASRPQIMRNTLFHNRGDDTFEEIADFCGLPASEWSWQPVFIDVDLDGYEDVIIPAGHTRDVQDLDATIRITSLQHPWPRNLDPKAHQEAFTREMMEHARLYPPLRMPILAFRNLGNLRFEDVTGSWGETQPGVHQGIAFGDFDGDGDLDFVVNNLNGACGIYRNNSIAPRVAVRLNGILPNSQAIGARVRLLGGATPTQSQEVVCGGRYLSGCDPALVFAAGSAQGGMTIEVNWRSGKRSVINGVMANRIYEIGETEDEISKLQAPSSREDPTSNLQSDITHHAPRTTHHVPLFEDCSHLLNHHHQDEPYDDFERQPLLPKKLSQLGPGMAWSDVDGDGWEDLIVGSGKGGKLAVYRNDGKGGFNRITNGVLEQVVTRDQTAVLGMEPERILVGSANYEDGLMLGGSVREYDLVKRTVEDPVPGAESSVGPLALGDIDGDGDLDLFIGGRVIGGRYPEAASSRVYRNDEGKWVLDEQSRKLLVGVGLVSGAVWSDLDGNGFPDLVLACEWGPVRIFRNERGRLVLWDAPVTINHQPSTINQLSGWWNGVTTGDLDGDGRLDIIASNWGLNSPYQATSDQPARLFHANPAERATVDLIETEYDPVQRSVVPRRMRDAVAMALPDLPSRFPTHRAYSQGSIADVLGSQQSRFREAQAITLASMVFLNRGDRFEVAPLPPEAQLAPAFSVNIADFDGDGREDLFLSQNFFANQPEASRLDAGRGLLLLGDGTGKLRAVPGQESGIKVYGEQRGGAAADYDADGRVDLVVSQNQAETRLFRNVGAKPGLRVRLRGSPANPNGIGAQIRLVRGQRLGPARELHAGSGYWSQDGAVQIMGTPDPPDQIQVRWLGGKTTVTPIPQGAREITVTPEGNLRVSP